MGVLMLGTLFGELPTVELCGSFLFYKPQQQYPEIDDSLQALRKVSGPFWYRDCAQPS